MNRFVPSCTLPDRPVETLPRREVVFVKGWVVFQFEDELHVPVKASDAATACTIAARNVGLFGEPESLTAQRFPEIDDRTINDVTARYLMKQHDWWFTCTECGVRITPQQNDYSTVVFRGKKTGLNDYENVFHSDCFDGQ